MTPSLLLISILAFIGGAVVGGAAVYAVLTPRLVPKESAMAPTASREPGMWLGRLMGVAVILCSLVSVGISVNASRDLSRVTACQTDYNERFAQALQARQVISDEDRGALDELVIRVASATSREESRDALQDYIDRRQRADRARARNPLPDPLNGRCEQDRQR